VMIGEILQITSMSALNDGTALPLANTLNSTGL
jgi:hypothetical protein